MRLTDHQIRTAEHGPKVSYLTDGNGLRLRLQPAPSTGKAWILRYTEHGKQRNKGLGSWPSVSLQTARRIASAHKLESKAVQSAPAPAQDVLGAVLAELKALRQTVEAQGALLARLGADPLPARPTVATPAPSTGKTFATLASEALERDSAAWKQGSKERHAKRIRRYALPTLGGMDVAAVTASDVANTLRPIWVDKAETASKTLDRIRSTFKLAIAQGLRADNPADSATAILPKRAKNGTDTEHHAALHYSDVAGALAKLDATRATPALKAMGRFIALTAARTGEARLARWSEIDLQGKLWSVPAGRMKASKAHIVPLSAAAIAVLKSLPHGGPDSYVFGNGKPLSDGTARKAFRRLGIATVHGLRSSFAEWCEDHDKDYDASEHALAHSVGTKVARAYKRSTKLEARRVLMSEWADYLAS